MQSRRNFLGRVASASLATMAVPGQVLGANERVRLGIIGSGDRGMQLVREAIQLADTEFVGFADIYTRRLEEAKRVVPTAKTYLDYRYLLEDKSIDAVIIATPQHLHCEHFVASLDAGKHVYQEKTMAFTVDHAKRMRAAYQRAGNRTVQIGHHWCSFGQVQDAAEFLKGDKLGKITAVVAHMFRNTPQGKPQWSRPLYPDMTPENILWKSFLGEAPEREFDANRYQNWRFFWDYSGGNVYENMCHQLSIWYKLLNLDVPRSANMSGGLYLWKDGREVPDTMNVAMEHDNDMMFMWNSGFGNNYLGVSENVLGTDATLVHTSGQTLRYLPQKVNQPNGTEMVGQTKAAPGAHMRNFIDCIRSGQTPNCPFEIGFRTSIACRMAVESYRQKRTIRWDPESEELV